MDLQVTPTVDPSCATGVATRRAPDAANAGASRRQPRHRTVAGILVVVAAMALGNPAIADDTTPTPHLPPTAAPDGGRPNVMHTLADLSGDYLWLAIVGSAHDGYGGSGGIDSQFGAKAAWLRVDETRPLSAYGVEIGAARLAATRVGHLWIDGAIGTRVHDVAMGLTAGPMVEISSWQHPHLGASVSAWVFAGVVPFARVSAYAEGGWQLDVGIELALPAIRW